MTRELSRRRVVLKAALFATLLTLVACGEVLPTGEAASSLASNQAPVVTITQPGAQALPDTAFVNVTPSRILHVAKDGCGTGGSLTCSTSNDGLSRATAVPSLSQAVSRSRNGDEIRVHAHSTAYAENIELYAMHAALPTAPRFIRGIADAQGKRPVITPRSGTETPPFLASAPYWVFDNLEVDCRDQRAPAFFAVGDNANPSHHIAVTRMKIHDCEDGVSVRNARDILIEGNEFHNLEVYSSTEPLDASGVVLENGAGRVLIKNNKAHHLTGDGVACRGSEQGSDVSSFDITIRDNDFYLVHEDAVDIKNCNRVSITGNNSFHDVGAVSDEVSPTGCGGSAVVIHYGAQNVLLEGADIYNAGVGLTVGNEHIGPPKNIVIRRNRIHDIKDGMSSDGAVNCGDGIRLQTVAGAEIYHNTIHNVSGSGIGAAVFWEEGYGNSSNIRIWNNIISDAQGRYYDGTASGGALNYNANRISGLYSDYNLVHRNGTQEVLRWVTPSGTARRVTFEEWTTLTGGLDAHGTDAAPLLQADLSTATGSAARNAALLDEGNAGANQRCGGGADIGARESDCGTIVSNPAVSTLRDTFNDGVLDANLWVRLYELGGTISESNGTLNLAAKANTDAVGLVVASKTPYSLVGSSIFVEVPGVVSSGGFIDQQLCLRPDLTNRLCWHAQNGTLWAMVAVNGVQAGLVNFTYSAAQHRWWRIRESSGTVFWETSADGQTWTTRVSRASSSLFPLNALTVQFFVETWNGGTATPGVARFDNLNMLPSNPPPPPPPPPTNPSPTTDVFGVRMIYPTRSGGEQWFMSANPTSDPRFDPQDPITANGDGSWKIRSSSVRMRAYTSTPYEASDITTYDRETLAQQGYMQAPTDWRNVEMTGFVKVNDVDDSTENLSWFARGGSHNDDEPCEGSAYHGDLFFNGQTRWQKENWHVSYESKPQVSTTRSIVGRWVGFKAVMRNITVNGRVTVKLELWLNDSADRVTWTKVYDTTDAGDWGGEASACGGRDDAMPISWGGPIAFFRWDGATDVDFKWLSVREIE